ncbi:DUF2521 family protein [Natribacillus halophilus]|uniref:DUF2521 domain-containing protein n=1 Tax=Natribacillus halophilus TaxID=549003 RepID=A0A1G8QU15_9BACI|nr:DUF2521 family protein [Natribacillus halophilus]SDJ08141.1 Protein of unknown function [Natribacillus halophilus]
MGSVVSFQEQKRLKDWEVEKKLLHTLSMEDMVYASEKYLIPACGSFQFRHSFLEEICMDVAIEAFITAAKRGLSVARTGKDKAINDDDEAQIRQRAHELEMFMSDWIQEEHIDHRKIANGADAYVRHWWQVGFATGKNRVQLRI